MDEMEEKIGAVLSNPKLMEQIMAMAQSLGSGAPPQPANSPPMPPEPEFTPGMDPAMLSKLAGIANQSGIDGNQRALLQALTPYLSRERIRKLEKAMRAARIAGMASVFLSTNSINGG